MLASAMHYETVTNLRDVVTPSALILLILINGLYLNEFLYICILHGVKKGQSCSKPEIRQREMLTFYEIRKYFLTTV